MRTEESGGAGLDTERIPTAETDVTGCNQMPRNVLSSWGGHLVFVAAGFIMPRLIDRHVGQVGLGIWDFCWSFVSYFSLAQIGVGSSVNRYVAQYRSTHDVDGVRRVVSSVTSVQIVAGLLALGMTAAVTWTLTLFFRERLGSDTDLASSVVALLGASLAIQIAFDAFRGVITGCHRWDLHNGLNAGSHAVTVAGMATALLLGGGLRSLGVVNLCGVMLTEVTRTALAYRVCPELRVRLAHASWSQARSMLAFGAKSVLVDLSRLLLVQTNSILVAGYLGPAALAIYARSAALVRHSETFVNKFAHVLTPTASALQGRGQHAELRELLIRSTRYGAYLALPMLLGLAILGDPILGLWMGPQYEPGLVLAILAAGYFLPLAQQPVVTILIGMNLHGPVGYITLVMATFGAGLGMITVGLLGWNLIGAALAVGLPLAIGSGALVPIYACRKLSIPLNEYFRRAFVGPIACSIPFALCLVAIRILFGNRPLLAVALGSLAAALVLGPLYWHYVIPGEVRQRIIRIRAGKRQGLAVPVSGSQHPSRLSP
jgi:O-antigen/teichoic acid export membrane protein